MSNHTMNMRLANIKTTIFSLALGVSLSLLITPRSGAQISISVGNINLQPNQTGQTHQFVVNNAGAPVNVLGVNFAITVADGQNATTAPTITAVDILTGSIFATDNNGVNSQMVTNKIWVVGTSDDGNPPFPQVPGGNSTIATVTFDTVGIMTGSFAVALDDLGNSPADYFDTNGDPLSITLTPGTITVVPEPSTALYLVVGGLGLAMARGRRRRKAGSGRG